MLIRGVSRDEPFTNGRFLRKFRILHLNFPTFRYNNLHNKPEVFGLISQLYQHPLYLLRTHSRVRFCAFSISEEESLLTRISLASSAYFTPAVAAI